MWRSFAGSTTLRYPGRRLKNLLIPTSPTMQSVNTKQVNAQNWPNDRLCGLNSDDFRPGSIATYITLQLAVPDEFSDVTYTISGEAITDNEVTQSCKHSQSSPDPHYCPSILCDIKHTSKCCNNAAANCCRKFRKCNVRKAPN